MTDTKARSGGTALGGGDRPRVAAAASANVTHRSSLSRTCDKEPSALPRVKTECRGFMAH